MILTKVRSKKNSQYRAIGQIFVVDPIKENILDLRKRVKSFGLHLRKKVLEFFKNFLSTSYVKMNH